MDNLASKLGALLENPDMMQKIMSLAQSFGNDNQQVSSSSMPGNETNPTFPDIDLQTIQKISGLAGQTNIDKNQKNLLAALGPYLSHYRISKLEKAMRAAKMARLASSFLGR